MAWKYDKDRITYFAETDFRGNRVKFGIREEDRARHMYIIGKTGMGKSTLLENLAVQDIINDEGLCFIDPHGGSAELLLRYVPEHRIKDVVYFAPHEMDFPIALNVLENDDPNKRPLIASGILSTFKKVWPDAWSGRMEYFLMNTLLALLETPGSTLLGVNRMYSDAAYREKVIANVTDTSVRAFWVDEYANMTEKMVAEATPAIQNKVGQFSMNPIMRNVLGQAESTFDIRKLMDERKIFIVNLSKGRMGETNAALLGALLVTKIYLAAMSRADLNEGDLKEAAPFHLYVDEFQNFANESFANILSEARKYKLALTIAHQYIEQMPEEVRDAVFGNVGTMITYRVGASDAEVLEKEFTPTFTMDDIVGLGFAQIYLKLMIKGAASTAFSARTSDKPPAPERNFEVEVREASRTQFGRPREEVEEIIKEWFTTDKSGAGAGDGRPGVKKFTPGQRPPFGAGGSGGFGSGPRSGPGGGAGQGGSGSERKFGERPPAPSFGQKAEGGSLRDALAGAGLAAKVAPTAPVTVTASTPSVSLAQRPVAPRFAPRDVARPVSRPPPRPSDDDEEEEEMPRAQSASASSVAEEQYAPVPQATPLVDNFGGQYEPQGAPQNYGDSQFSGQYAAPQPMMQSAPQYPAPQAPQYHAPQYQQPTYAPQYPPQYQAPQQPYYPQYQQPQYYPPYGYPPMGYAPMQYQPQPMYPVQPQVYQAPLYQPYPPMIHYSPPPVPTTGPLSPPPANPVSPVIRRTERQEVKHEERPREERPRVERMREDRIREEKPRVERAREEKPRESRTHDDARRVDAPKPESQTPRREPEKKQEARSEKQEQRSERSAEKPRTETTPSPSILARQNDGKGPSEQKLDALAAALAKLSSAKVDEAHVSAPAPAAAITEDSKPEPKEVPLDVLKKVLE